VSLEANIVVNASSTDAEMGGACNTHTEITNAWLLNYGNPTERYQLRNTVREVTIIVKLDI